DVLTEKTGPKKSFRSRSDVTQTRPAAKRCRHRQIREEQECAHDCKKATLRTRSRIDATAIGKVSTNDDVVDSDQRSDRADRKNNRERGEPGGDERKSCNVGLACAPVTIQQRRCALPIDVARTMRTACGFKEKFGHGMIAQAMRGASAGAQ